METWKDIPKYEGIYQASTFGRIRNSAGLIMKLECTRNGYVRVDLCLSGVCIKTYIHRIIALVFLPSNPDSPYVNHKDLNKQNNRLENLEWISPSGNTQHYYDNRVVEKVGGWGNDF